MGSRELTSKYGVRRNIATCVNRAIRAELAGGDAALDGLDEAKFERNWQAEGWLRKIVDEMAAEIRKRYEIGEFAKKGAK